MSIPSPERMLALSEWWIRRLRSRVAAFGLPSGLRYVLLESRSRSVVHSVSVPGGTHKVAVRLGRRESDMTTLIHVFHEKCYAFDIAPPRSIIDAGANVGYSALWFAIEYPSALVVAIEPDPRNAALLRRNTAGCPNVTVLEAALAGEAGRAVVVDPGQGPCAHRIQRQDNPWSDGNALETVDCVTVEQVRKQFDLDQIDLLKVDIEGSELELLAGNPAWMASVEAAVFELHDRFRQGCTRAFVAATSDFPFECYRGENVFVSRRPFLATGGSHPPLAAAATGGVREATCRAAPAGSTMGQS